MSDVEQLVDVIRKMRLIENDVADMQGAPVSERNDSWYRMIATWSVEYDTLSDDRGKLIKRIPNGLAFVGWLASNYLID